MVSVDVFINKAQFFFLIYDTRVVAKGRSTAPPELQQLRAVTMNKYIFSIYELDHCPTTVVVFKEISLTVAMALGYDTEIRF